MNRPDGRLTALLALDRPQGRRSGPARHRGGSDTGLEKLTDPEIPVRDAVG